MGMRLERRGAVTTVAAFALLAAAPAGAFAGTVTEPAPRPVPRSAQSHPAAGTFDLKAHAGARGTVGAASVVCDSVGNNTYRWWGNCRVLSGYARAITVCTFGTIYGSWVGVGYWRFGGDCFPYALLRYGVQYT